MRSPDVADSNSADGAPAQVQPPSVVPEALARPLVPTTVVLDGDHLVDIREIQPAQPRLRLGVDPGADEPGGIARSPSPVAAPTGGELPEVAGRDATSADEQVTQCDEVDQVEMRRHVDERLLG